MKCQDIMSKNLETLTERDPIARAARLMATTGVGFLPVCDAELRVIGVVTDRDLVTRGLANDRDPETTWVGKVMTSPVVTCAADADLHLAEELMAQERKSRIVVIHPDGRLAGILSVADIIERAPQREALHTIKAVLWREALGPRAGAPRGQALLRDLPPAPVMAAADLPHPTGDVFTGGNHAASTKEFGG
jgi:CBS domain-containing protein